MMDMSCCKKDNQNREVSTPELLKLEELTLEQKIGQLLCVRSIRPIKDGEEENENHKYVMEMLRKKCVGGIQVASLPGCEKEIANLREAAGYPVLICADMERGLRGSENSIPSMMSLGAANDTALAYDFGCITAIDAKKKGYSVVWGPVIDMIDGNGLCKVPRVFSSDAEKVGEMGCAMMKGYLDNGLLATGKHFLFSGDSSEDTHMVEGVSHRSREELMAHEMKPYLNVY